MTALMPALRAISAVFLLGLLGCAADGKRDQAGRSMELSAAGLVSPEDADLNVGLWIPPRLISSIERKIRDNIGVNETIKLVQPGGAGRGHITTERFELMFFSTEVMQKLSSVDR